MATENKLSDKLLKSLSGKPSEKQLIMADGRGLSIRVSKAGGVSFVFYYRTGGRTSPPVWLTLGRYPDMSLANARKMRDQCREWLAMHLDPRNQMKIEAERSMMPVTIKDAIMYWYDNHAITARKEHEYLIQRFDKHIFPHIGNMPIEKSKLHDWLTCFDRIKKKAPVMSGAIFLDIKQALRFCRVRQYISCDPLGDIGVNYVGRSSGIRDRVLDVKETADVWSFAFGNNLLNIASAVNQRMFVLCMAFGCRQREARLSTWSEWDFENWIWTVPKEHSKNGEAIVRPVPVGIRQWITNLHAATKRSDFIIGVEFSRAGVTSAANRICKRLGHDKNGLWCIHDFRRTFSTSLNDMGGDPYIIELLLGHKIKGVAGVYNKSRHLNKKLKVLNMWVNYLNAVAGFDNNVVELNKEVV
ncbi:Putative prophage CPS-53 integrase [Serratia quinivorans]|uniref:Prophage CPS-53 integrase n=1 Tax=Serratia quinivorans TaxID=137545 RepID=A0A380AHL9_9GAMM|nr:site-specific integrase [Serratia proteamaculans]RYM59075.1 integrase [Serratia proteamaculans]SUI81319.1 Putative prophage CPS-53 integrase [Serratia quinivorans]